MCGFTHHERQESLNLPTTPFLVGRDSFIEQLHSTLRAHQVVVVSGESGVGKTTVVREYTRRFAQDYQAVIQLDAATDETFLAGTLAALQTYALPINIQQGIVSLFQELYTYAGTQQRALLILDNLTHNFFFQDASQLPPTLQVIIITQAEQTPPEVPRLDVPELDAHESVKLLLHEPSPGASQETPEPGKDEYRAALELARELHSLPLTVSLAGRYLGMTGCTVREYLTMFRHVPALLHAPTGFEARATKALSFACELTLSYLRETNSTAFEHLQLCALLVPEAIPVLVFSIHTEREQSDNEVGQEQEQTTESSDNLRDAGLLDIELEQGGSFVHMHPLVQEHVRQSISEEQQERYIQQLLRFFYQKLPLFQQEALPVQVRLAGQIRHLATLSEGESAFFDALIDVNEAGEVFAWASGVLAGLQLVQLGEPLLRRGLKICQHTLGEHSPLVATFLLNLAKMNMWLNKYVDAEAFAHRAVVSTTNALGIAHPDVLLALHQLGQVYEEQGKLNRARQCYEKALSIGERVALHTHPYYTQVVSALALLKTVEAETPNESAS
jgi:tetratricopeptide (TPR) repeat protein